MKAVSLDQIGIGQDFKKAREHLGLSYAALSQKTGISGSHIWNLENGEKEMSLEKFFALCCSLGIPASQLMADNLVVEQTHFGALAYDKLLSRTPPMGNEVAAVIGGYVGACSVIICHILLSPSSEFSDGLFEFPSQGISDAFNAVTTRLKMTASIKQRFQLFEQIQADPLAVVDSLLLLKQPLIHDLLDYMRKRKESGQKIGWTPKPTKRLEDSYVEKPESFSGFDPQLFGRVIREMEEEKTTVYAKHLRRVRKKNKKN